MSRSSSFILRWLPHLAALLVIVLCARLAAWQFDRADEKRTLLSAWEQADRMSLEQAESLDSSYARISARGQFDTRRHVLLDNQIRAGRAGVHVFTPFRPDGASGSWLVNRGWYPLASRQAPLPSIETPSRAASIEGRLVDPPRVGRQLGEARALDADEWPNLVTYLDLDRVEAALETSLAGRIILLDPAHDIHLTGDPWRPVNFGPDRHRAYAWQWITMAVVVFLIWVALTWRSFRKS
ncbi:MAG: hypothetical protein GVY32_00275 [Gammaproteobacteria bacterium]|jgi:surfeit locus 1 family protein|nr:hypothetical protein [Gammaproteobacteria bacterium]